MRIDNLIDALLSRLPRRLTFSPGELTKARAELAQEKIDDAIRSAVEAAQERAGATNDDET